MWQCAFCGRDIPTGGQVYCYSCANDILSLRPVYRRPAIIVALCPVCGNELVRGDPSTAIVGPDRCPNCQVPIVSKRVRANKTFNEYILERRKNRQ